MIRILVVVGAVLAGCRSDWGIRSGLDPERFPD